MKTIGQSMREVRQERGLTLPQLAKMAGVSERSIELYEVNKVYPGVLNLVALADALEISIDDYIGHRIKG